jgi:hypothetical protein
MGSKVINNGLPEQLNKLGKLHADGVLTDGEFTALKEKLVARSIDAQAERDTNARAPMAGVTLFSNFYTHGIDYVKSVPNRIVVGIVLIFGIVMCDKVFGPLFPDTLYCSIGAGVEMTQPAQVNPSGWSMNGNCNMYIPGCATSWQVVPAREYCAHGTLWDAIRRKFYAARQNLTLSVTPSAAPVPTTNQFKVGSDCIAGAWGGVIVNEKGDCVPETKQQNNARHLETNRRGCQDANAALRSAMTNRIPRAAKSN